MIAFLSWKATQQLQELYKGGRSSAKKNCYNKRMFHLTASNSCIFYKFYQSLSVSSDLFQVQIMESIKKNFTIL